MSRGGSARRFARGARRVPKGQKDPYREDPKVGRTIDFTGVGDYKPAPRGTYTIEFTKYEFAETKSGKNAGSEYVKGQWTITDELADDGETKVSGKVVYHNWSLLPQSLWVFKGDAVAAGIEPARLEGAVDIEAILTDMVGRKTIGEVEVEDYVYPEGHQKAGQHRYSNSISSMTQADIPEALQPAGRRR